MLLLIAWRNIWRNKRRTLITLASIGFAVFFACIMQSMQLGSYERMIENAVRFYTGHIQVHEKGYWDDKTLDNSLEVTESLQTKLSGEADLSAYVPRIESFALASHGTLTKGVLVNGIDPIKETGLTDLQGKIVEGQYLSTPGDIMIGEGLSTYLKAAPGDTLVLISQGYHGANAAGKYRIVGTLKFPTQEMSAQAAYIMLSDAQYFFNMPNRATSLALLLDNSEAVPGVKADLTSKLDTAVYEVMDWKELMPELVQSIEIDYASGRIMLYVLYAIIAFGIFGTFLMMTNERQYEFGVMLSIGMKRRLMQGMLLLEIIMLAVLGVVMGIIAASPILAYFYLNPIQVGGEMAQAYEKMGMEPILPFSLAPEVFVNQAQVVLVMTILMAIYPLWIVGKLKVIKALRS
ncbi:MAG: ABC transporter permease [Imperialibacter sp.]|uniref:ABC transporter permease n=1 Tax=Imperialibacter sp. TaxID=2038411 RepID=UPI003A85D246